MRRSLFLAAVLLLSLARSRVVCAQSAATPPPAPSRYWVADLAVIAGFNQLQGALLAGVRHRWDAPRHTNVLLDHRRMEAGFEANVNPAFTALGAYVEFTPLQIFSLRVQYDGFAYYGTFGGVLGFDDATQPFGDAVRNQRDGQQRPGYVHRVLVRPTLQAQLGPVIVRNVTDLSFVQLVGGTERYWIDLEHDVLSARNELFVMNQSQLLFEPWREPEGRGVMFGAHYEVAGGVASGVRRQRVAGVLDWVFAKKLSAFVRPRATAMMGYHIEDRNRGGGGFGIIALSAEFAL